jgi:glycosyltransferase involved in cell wall biosynthesis
MGELSNSSIIVRTQDRPTLPRTLDSIARQTRRPAEIVLVDALGTLAPRFGHDGVPVHFVSLLRKLSRTEAANAGLASATSQWLLLLDEDDEIEPTHLEDLFAALAREPLARVAYSQTRLVDPAGQADRVFGGPFNRAMLFQSNYISTHSALFARSLVSEGCRYDETFEILDDWDFWLQAAMRTPFAFTGKPTAVYHAAGGASGAGAGGNLDRERLLAHREKLMGKWATARAALGLAGG